jgi:pimeloyl-ACP methyl ester carboxylesterase
MMNDAIDPAFTPARMALGDGVSIAYHRQPGKSHVAEASSDGGDVAGMPAARPAKLPGVMFLGGFKSDMTGSKAAYLAEYCAASGQDYIRFDYQGHGASSGGFEEGSIGTWASDAIAVLDNLTEGPQILVGSSMGGWLMLLTALARPDQVAGLVGIAPAPDFTEDLMWAQMDEATRRTLLDTGRVVLPSAYGDEGYVITRKLIEDGRRHLLLGSPIALDVPVRLLHGTSDDDVPWELSLRLARTLTSGDVAVTLVKNGDHRLSSPADLERLGQAVAAVTGAAAYAPR